MTEWFGHCKQSSFVQHLLSTELSVFELCSSYTRMLLKSFCNYLPCWRMILCFINFVFKEVQFLGSWDGAKNVYFIWTFWHHSMAPISLKHVVLENASHTHLLNVQSAFSEVQDSWVKHVNESNFANSTPLVILALIFSHNLTKGQY